MKVWEVQNTGNKNTLNLSEKPMPKPGPFQVLLKMKATSLNYRDLLILRGAYGSNIPLPLIPLSDGVGEVVEVGQDVTRVKKGDRVAGIFMQKWIGGKIAPEHTQSALGGSIGGMLAEYTVLHEDGLVRVPEHLTDEEAATLPCAAVTAWNALVNSGNLQSGESVLVQGTGGVSIFALQFARMMGARVIATSSSDEKLQRAMQLGASDGINYKQFPNWSEKVMQFTNSQGVDHVVEVGGHGTLNESLRSVKIGGHIAMIGVLTGVSGEVSTVSMLIKYIRVQGIYVGSREMFEAMNRAIAFHQMKPVVDRVFPFNEAPEAYRYLESGAHFGKVCIRL